MHGQNIALVIAVVLFGIGALAPYWTTPANPAPSWRLISLGLAFFAGAFVSW
jgi:hypothetical protein